MSALQDNVVRMKSGVGSAMGRSLTAVGNRTLPSDVRSEVPVRWRSDWRDGRVHRVAAKTSRTAPWPASKSPANRGERKVGSDRKRQLTVHSYAKTRERSNAR